MRCVAGLINLNGSDIIANSKKQDSLVGTLWVQQEENHINKTKKRIIKIRFEDGIC